MHTIYMCTHKHPYVFIHLHAHRIWHWETSTFESWLNDYELRDFRQFMYFSTPQFPCEKGRDGLTALGHVRMGWGEWRVQAAPWPWRPNCLHYDETDAEPVRLTPERANPQVTQAWQVYPMWRQALKAPKPMQNYSGINLSQKLKKAAILSIHLLKVLIQLFYLLQLKNLIGLAEHHPRTTGWNKMYFLSL